MVRLLDISSDGGALAAASCMHGAPCIPPVDSLPAQGGGGGGGEV